MFGAPKFAAAGAADYSSSDDDSNDDQHHDGEFHPRKRRRMGKESAALGVFGDDSDDDDTRPGKQWKGKTLRSKGMAFISSGAQNPIEDEDLEDLDNVTQTMIEDDDSDSDDDGDDDDDDDDDDDEAEPGSFFRGGLGLGATKASQDQEDDDEDEKDPIDQPTFTPATFISGKPTKSTSYSHKSKKPQQFDSSNPFGRGFVPSSAYIPTLNQDVLEEKPQAPVVPKSSAFASGKKSKFGNSFAQRMMAKMGYKEGEGLGADSQGRNIVIEANLRPQGVGLGAVKEKSEQERREEKRQAALRGEKLEESSDEERRRRKEKKKKAVQVGRAGGTATERAKARVAKGKFMTAEELKRTAPGLHIPEAFTPILDMTGPDVSTLTSTAGLMKNTQAFVSATEAPEVAEKRKLIKRSHVKLAALSEEWSTLAEHKAWVDKQLEELTQSTNDVAADAERLAAFTTIIIEELPQAKGWRETMACLDKAAATGAAIDEMSDTIVSVIYPLIKDADWNPLLEPTRFATDLIPLAPILVGSSSSAAAAAAAAEDAISSHRHNDDHLFAHHHDNDVYRRHHKQTTAYESLMYKLWLPRVLSAVRSWNAHDPDILLGLLNTWKPLLPAFVHAQLIAAITRHLDNTLASWNPKKSAHLTTLPHTWVFPWLPYIPSTQLDPKGNGLVADVKRKFRALLAAWDYSKGVIPGLLAWREVLGSEWTSLLLGHALPAMGTYLGRNFCVDPADQAPYLPMLQGVLKWGDVLGHKTVGEIVKSQIFPMWHARLEEWLSSGEVNFAEVAEWFSWWDTVVLPKNIQKLPGVREELEKGLAVMERGVEALAI